MPSPSSNHVANPHAREQLIQAELDAFRAKLVQSWQDKDLPEHVKRALTCIHSHLFEERLSVAFIRVQCGLHNHNVSCQFKHFVGMGMRSYIEEQRLQLAERLLLHDMLSISEIAWAVGYVYLESFERAFKRRTGCSPQQLREVQLRRSVKTKC